MNDPEFVTDVPLSELVQYNRLIKILYSKKAYRTLIKVLVRLGLRFYPPLEH